MADLAITGLTEDTAPTTDDLVVTVSDPAGTPVNRKVALANLGLGITPAWTAWTPSWTNVTGGTDNYSDYVKIGKTIIARIKYTLGGTGVSGAITVSVPVNMNADFAAVSDYLLSTVTFNDAGNAVYPGTARWASASTVSFQAINAAGTNAAYTATSSTVPFTWNTGDIIQAHFCYEGV